MLFQRGLGVVEIVMVIAIIGIAVFSIFELLVLTNATRENQARRVQATALAQSAVEVVKTLRAAGWDANISSLTSESTYYPVQNSGAWTLTTANPGPIDNLFSQTVTLHAVTRDSSDNISATGANDDNTRRISVSVAWEERGQSREVALETYITNYLQN